MAMSHLRPRRGARALPRGGFTGGSTRGEGDREPAGNVGLAPSRSGGHNGPSAQGPVTANVMPGHWALKKSQRPSGLKTAPANSL